MHRQRVGNPPEGGTQRAARAGLLAALVLLWGCTSPLTAAPGERPSHAGAVRFSLLAVGDTGRLPVLGRAFHRQRAVGRGLAAEDERLPADALLLLGDNFYWKGLESGELVHRVRENVVGPYCRFVSLSGPRSAEVAGACPRRAADPRSIPIHVVFGNHDYKSAWSPALQRRAVPAFVPNWHAMDGLVEVVEFPAGVSLVLLDAFALVRGADPSSLRDALRRSRGPWRILATHYPLAWAHDVAPGRPGVNRGFTDRVRAALREAGVPVQLALAGHEHNLQLIEMPEGAPGLQVVAGSGSRVRALSSSNPRMHFGAARPGFARVDLVGAGDSEALRVELYATGSVPWLARPERLAAVSVDPLGRLHMPAFP